MKIRRGIFGGALLFAAAGCTDAKTSTPSDAGTEVTMDAQVSDASVDSVATDAASPDTNPPTDVGVDAAVTDVTVIDIVQADTSVSDSDDADVLGEDIMLNDTAEVVDVLVDTLGPMDASEPVDTSEPMDAGSAMDTAGAIDVSEEDTAGCKLLTVETALGEKCDKQMAAICEPDQPQEVALVCYQSTWKKMSDLSDQFPIGCFCEPGMNECSYAFAICAVPGFIGLDRAGRLRQAPRRLRLV